MTKDLVRGIRYLPTLPTVLHRIMELLDDERSSAADLEKIVEKDQALSSKVLAVANSAYYGFRHKILTVRRATVALGYEEIRNICLGASLMGFLHPSTFRDQRYAELLWLHSLAVAEAGRIIHEHLHGTDEGAAYTAGLLHDLGKVVLAAFYPDEVDKVHALRASERLTYRQAEIAQGVDHAKVGRSLAEHWDLPPVLVEALGHHHEFHSGLVYVNMACQTHMADYLARRNKIGDSGNPDAPEFKPRAVQILNLTEEGLKSCGETLLSRRQAVESLWQTLIANVPSGSR